jgi:hypothetical protein
MERQWVRLFGGKDAGSLPLAPAVAAATWASAARAGGANRLVRTLVEDILVRVILGGVLAHSASR